MDSEDGRLHLFGTVHWRTHSRTHSSTDGRVELPDNLPGWLIAYLAYRGDWFGRDALAALCWPERPEREAQHNLRANLHRARAFASASGFGECIEAERSRVRLRVDSDVAAFRLAIGRGDWAGALRQQAEPLLGSLSFRGFALLEAWARGEREALAEAWCGAALKSAHQAEHAGHAMQAADGLLQLLQRSDPTEDAVQALLRVAAAAGRRAEALAAYERLRRHLQHDLGLLPTEATLELVRALQTAARVGAPTSIVAVTKLGHVPRAVDQPPRLIGRNTERAALADRASAIAVISGEPGVGKTRLLEECCPTARWLGCRQGLDQVPFAAVVEYLVDHAEGLPDPGEYRRDLARLLPQFGSDELLPPSDPLTTKPRLLDALAHMIETGAATVVFDDLQWADAATRELVLHLARRGRVVLRLACRSNETHAALDALLDALDASQTLQRLALAPLSNEALSDLLADLSHTSAGPPRFGHWLHALTGGNPFFALQTLRALFESGRLQAHADGWSSDLDLISSDYSEFEMPPRVADLVRRRLQALNDNTRRVLSAAAVLGHAHDSERLAAAVGLSAWAVAESIAQAQSAGLLDEGRFRHDLIRHAALQATPAPLQRVLHATLARLFEGVLPPAELARHWWAAQDIERAVAATLRAAEHDGHAGLHEQAIEQLERALAYPLPPHDVACLQVSLARMHLARGELERAEAAVRHALDEPALPRERAMAYALIGALRMQQGRLQEAGAALDEAATSDPDEPAVLAERSRLALLEGRVDEVVAELERQRNVLRRRAPGPELVGVLTSLGAAYDELSRPEHGLPLHQEAWNLAVRLGARYAQVDVAINWLWCLSALGRDDDAVLIARQSLALGDYASSATLRNNLAWSLVELGRIEEARELYEALVADSDPTLALIARARLVDLRGAGAAGAVNRQDVQSVVDAMASTEVYLAQAAAALVVLRYGDEMQLQAVLRYLRPQPIDAWLAGKLQHALQARGIDPAPYLSAAAQLH